MTCHLLDTVFQTDVKRSEGGYISLGVYLTTTGVDPSTYANNGVAGALLMYAPAGTTTIFLPAGPHQPERQIVVGYPDQFSGVGQYSLTQETSDSQNITSEQLTISIHQDPSGDGGYYLTLSSPSVNGSCSLQCVGNGNVAYGVLGGSVVAISMRELQPGYKSRWPV